MSVNTRLVTVLKTAFIVLTRGYHKSVDATARDTKSTAELSVDMGTLTLGCKEYAMLISCSSGWYVYLKEPFALMLNRGRIAQQDLSLSQRGETRRGFLLHIRQILQAYNGAVLGLDLGMPILRKGFRPLYTGATTMSFESSHEFEYFIQKFYLEEDVKNKKGWHGNCILIWLDYYSYQEVDKLSVLRLLAMTPPPPPPPSYPSSKETHPTLSSILRTHSIYSWRLM